MLESDGSIGTESFDDLVGKVMSRLLQDPDDVAPDDPLDYLQRIATEVDSEWDRYLPLAAGADLSASVKTAYGELPNGHRQILRMHIFDDLSYAQIGQRTGLGATGALRTLAGSYSALLTAWSRTSWIKAATEPQADRHEARPLGSGALEEEVFTAALALPTSERDRYLMHACEGDPALQARMKTLLAAFESRIGSAARLAAMRAEGVGDRINNFELLEEIGEGGCGVVFLAQQILPLRREVALKVIKQGMDTRAVIARFEGERQTLAMMDHPNIARVFDAGATPSGRPFFVMELVRGIKITDFCNQTRLTISDRLALLVQVCHAIQHAHQRSVIHRDIKPSNVLVTLLDGVPTAKVIDFGIAKAMQGRLIDRSFLTAVEQFVGTPTYTSPEQTQHGDVDERSDIFSLGVLLYELLTGHTPLEVAELAHVGMDELRHRIRSEEPLRPSKRLRMLDRAQLDQVAQRYRTTGHKLIRLLQRDLEWVVMRCLEKDPAQRYQSVTDLRLDVERCLRDEPVLARPRHIVSTFARFARRHRTVFATGAAIIAILLVATVIAVWLAVRETRANRTSQQTIDRLMQQEFISHPDRFATENWLELQREYPQLVAKLGMSSDEAERFLDLLAEQGLREIARAMKVPRGQDPVQWRRKPYAQAGQDPLAFLGEERFRTLVEYVNTASARAFVDELRSQLATSSSPLREEQVKALVKELAIEHERHAAERHENSQAEISRNGPWTAATPVAQQIEYMERRAVLIQASLDRQQKAGEMYLDAVQQRAFKAMLDRHREHTRELLEAWRTH